MIERPASPEKMLEQSLTTFHKANDEPAIAHVILELAQLHMEDGRITSARQQCNEAALLAEKLGSPSLRRAVVEMRERIG